MSSRLTGRWDRTQGSLFGEYRTLDDATPDVVLVRLVGKDFSLTWARLSMRGGSVAETYAADRVFFCICQEEVREKAVSCNEKRWVAEPYLRSHPHELGSKCSGWCCGYIHISRTNAST